MLSDLIPLLQHPDAATRKNAIRQIANQRDPAALPHLAQVYRTDADQEVRDLALKAGRFIRAQVGAATQASPDATDSPSTDSASADSGSIPADTAHPYDTGDDGTASEPEAVSQREREMARGLLDTAAGFALNNDPARAIENLGKALALDPDLRKETFAVNLTAQLTGMSLNQALPLLIHPDRRAALIGQFGGKRKLKREQRHGTGADDATWDRVAVDFGIYWIVNVLTVFAAFAIITVAMQNAFDEYAASNATYSAMADDMDDVVAASMVGLLIASLFVALLNTIALAINGAAIHFAASYVFGGDGTLAYLYRRYVSFNTVVIVAFAAFGILLAIFDAPTVMLVGMSFGGIAASVIIVYFTVQIISNVYAFGMGAGCGTLIVAGIILVVLEWIAIWVLSGVITALLEVGA